MKSSLRGILDRRLLRGMAGARSFERGEGYFTGGRVRGLAELRERIAAKVQGARLYRVKLSVEDGGLEHSCTCPLGADGAFCKHCVAVGLAWLKQTRPGGGKPAKAPKPAVTMREVRAFLTSRDKATLVDVVMEQAMDDDRLRQRLLMKTAKKGPRGLDLATYREAIDSAVDLGQIVDYGGSDDYAQSIDEVVDSVGELLREGHAGEVVELAEHAIGAVEDSMRSVDDSDGYVGAVLERLQELHLKACRKARPDPEELARRLFAWEVRADSEAFFGATQTYADVLGRKGLAVYRELAEAEWRRLPPAATDRDDPGTEGKRFLIMRILETLARRTGDVEAVVAVKRRDLSFPHAYLQIAEIYREARRYALALEWAERGVKAFPGRTDPRLREFLAGEYHRRKRHDEAMALVWAEFADSPDLRQFQNLKSHADRVKQWPAWREKALAFMREAAAKDERGAKKNRWGWLARPDHSELVKVLLWERDVDAAWREAREGGCSDELWMDLAGKREKDHPGDALAVYQNQVEPTLAEKNDGAYREAVDLLRTIRGLMVRLGRQAEFAPYLESVRAAHKPKRNFMKRLERAAWSSSSRG